tara:strand:- start:104 stop:964 length:861 start_codon:yes stop_codon:yes gene_type:complete
VVDRTPIFVEVDGLDRPTGLSEFVSGIDVVSQELGGTGATSVSGVVIGLGSSILLDELASGVTIQAQQATGLVYDSGTRTITPETGLTTMDITGKTFITSSLEAKLITTNTFTSDNVTASAFAFTCPTITGASVSATAVSGLTFNGVPYPAPFAYIQLTSDDVASSDEKHVGYSNTPTSVVSNTDDITWDDSAKNFVVKKVGTYECVGRLFFEGGSTLIELHVNVEGSPVNTANPRAHTTVDPVERTISAIFTCAVDDVVDITYEATSAQTTAAQIGTTVTIKRLK